MKTATYYATPSNKMTVQIEPKPGSAARPVEIISSPQRVSYGTDDVMALIRASPVARGSRHLKNQPSTNVCVYRHLDVYLFAVFEISVSFQCIKYITVCYSVCKK